MPFHMALLGLFFGAAGITTGFYAAAWTDVVVYAGGGLALGLFGTGVLVSRLLPWRTKGG